MRTAAVWLSALALFAGQPRDPAEVLARARARLLDTVRRLPRYTCTQTVNRSFYSRTELPRIRANCDTIIGRPRDLKLTATDRLRLEVAIADSGREIYSWAGAGRIESERAAELVGGGPFGTGSFGPFLKDIFANPGAGFSYGDKLGGEKAAGENLIEYRFRVPREFSHYQVQGSRRSHFFPYDGAFWLDPDSSELKRLTIRTAELPADSGACEATTTVDFQHVRVGGGDFLLPGESRLRIVYRDGTESENATAYSGCREYSGESVVRFEEEAGSAGQPSRPVSAKRADRLPSGLSVLLSLETEIDTDRAAAGDPIVGRVIQDVLDRQSKRILVPAGATAHGRITKIEHRIDTPPCFLVAMWFDRLRFLDREWAFSAKLGLPLLNRFGQPFQGRVQSQTKFSSAGTFVFRSLESRYVVPRGFESRWQTVGLLR